MARKLAELRVFLATPGDLEEEREVAANVLNRVNLQIAEPRGLYLKLLQFPTTILPGIGTEPQDVINRQIKSCDIYLVVFWKRLGTPTRGYSSGTVEEFEQAYGNWLSDPNTRVLVYFSKRPFYPTADEITEIAKVFGFKNKLSERGVLYSSFDNIQEFEVRLYEHLARLVLEREVVSDSDRPTLLYQLGLSKNFTRDLTELLDESDEIAVIYIDLDQFKEINLTLTPERGTEVLNDLACAIFNTVRNRAHLYRYAGDEFAVIMTGRPQHDVVALAEKIRRAIETSGPYGNRYLTASIGAACAPSVPKNALFAEAYRAAYVSKLSGKNRVTICPLSKEEASLIKDSRQRDSS